jgi:hypothetical protein
LKLDPTTQMLLDLMFGYADSRTKELEKHKRQLAHYTTADTAMKIIKGRSIWLRNAAVMNDHSEIEHGRATMEPILKYQHGDRLRAILDAASPGAATKVMERHEGDKQTARETVFMTSLSEHPAGDVLGKLSMWRAYGGPVAGVALLFNRAIATIETSVDLELIASPVFYGGINEFEDEFRDLVDRLDAHPDILRSVNPEILVSAASTALQFAMLSIKHRGFAEEEEWRLIHRPYEYSSAHVQATTVTIGGIPQTIYGIPFHAPHKGHLFNIPDLQLGSILEGVIIGPCLHPETVRRAFIDEMIAIGIENAKDRVFVSDIPLRQWG